MCEVTKSIRSGLVLAQQPWTYATKFKSKLRGWNLFQGIETVIVLRRAFMLLPISVVLQSRCFQMRISWQLELTMRAKGRQFVFVSAYMAAEEPAPPQFTKGSVGINRNWTNSYYSRNWCKCTSHHMGNLWYKPSRKGSVSILCWCRSRY